jgi:hypothetical protein
MIKINPAPPTWYVEAWVQAGGRFDESGRAVWTDVGRMQGERELTNDRTEKQDGFELHKAVPARSVRT